MKKVFLMILILAFSFTISSSTLAAVHNFTGDFANYKGAQFGGLDFDGWYSIDRDSPSLTTRYVAQDDDWALGFEYYQNDQFFVDLTYGKFYDTDYYGDRTTLTGLQGSYLDESGFFFGLDYTGSKYRDGGYRDNSSQTFVSAGLRQDLGKNNGYVAGSLDFAIDGDLVDETGIYGLDLDFKYFTDKTKIYGQLYLPNEDVADYDSARLDLAANIQVDPAYIVGFKINNFDDANSYEFGITGAVDKQIVAELRYKHVDTGDASSSSLDAQALYAFTNELAAGMELEKVKHIDDPYLRLKAKYAVDKDTTVKFVYQFENDAVNQDPIVFLRWDVNIK